MEGRRYLLLNDLNAYKISFALSNYVWGLVVSWDYFSRNTVGSQFVRAVDSISANIAEGFGRYGKKDKINFYRYSFGSVKESLDWNEKSKNRGLFGKSDYTYIYNQLIKLPKEINALIKYTREKLEE